MKKIFTSTKTSPESPETKPATTKVTTFSLASLFRPLLGGIFLASFFLVLQASGVTQQVPGIGGPPTASACGGWATYDWWADAYTGNGTYSTSRLVNWQYTITSGGWCYPYHFASFNGGASWYSAGGGPVVVQVTAGADGYANSVVGNSLLYQSCTNANRTGTCSELGHGSMNNNLLIDTVGPNPPTITYPTSTLYTAATSGTVTWTGYDATSGIAGYSVNWRWATLSNGSCVNQGGDSGWYWIGNTNSWGPGWGGGNCFQFQVAARDNAGNNSPASAWSAWIESDQTLPVYQGNLNATCFVPGQTVTLTQSGTYDPAPSSALNGYYYYANNWANGTGWITSGAYSYTVPTPAAGTQGSNQFEATAMDNAGNYLWQGWSYSVDNTYPSGLSVSGPTYTSTPVVNLTLHSTAGGCAGVSNVALNDGGTWVYNQPANGTISWDLTAHGGGSAQGTHTITAAFYEGSNWNYVSTTIVYDYSAPVTSATCNGAACSSGWYSTPTVSVALSASDTYAGVSNTKYTLNGGAATTYSGTISISAEQINTLTYWSTDLVGNVETTQTINVKLDRTAPTVIFTCAGTPGPGYSNNTCGPSNWFVGAVTVTFSGTDALSGLTDLSYQLDGGSAVNLSTPPNNTGFTVGGDGKHSISLCVKDVANNQTCTGSFVYIDSTPAPVSSTITPITPDGLANWYVTDPTIGLTTTDGTSGFNDPLWQTDNLAGLYYQIDGSQAQKTTSLTNTITTSFNLSDGNHSIVYWTIDAAHNTSSQISMTTKVDTIRPHSLFSANAGGLNTDHLTAIPVSLSSSDEGSGTTNSVVHFSTDGGVSWGSWLPLAADGSYTGTIAFPNGANTISLFALEEQVRDNAGNLGIPRTGPSPTGELDVPPNLSVIFAVSPVNAEVCSQTVYLTNTNKVTWPTEQSFCLAPRLGSPANPVGTHDNGALIGVPWTGEGDAITQYSFASLTDNPYLSNPATDESGQVHFTPKAETADGVQVTVTFTANVAFWLPSQLDNNGVPKTGEIPQKITPMSFTITGNIIILNSGTVIQQ